MERYGFNLVESEFQVALAEVRSPARPRDAPSACNKKFTLAHALQCPTAQYTQIKRNEMENTSSKLMNEISYDVETRKQDLDLQPLQNQYFSEKSKIAEIEAIG